MMMNLKISLAQFNIHLGKLEKNLEMAIDLIRLASQRKSDIILLPELWTSGYDLENAHQHSNSNNKILSTIRSIAIETQLSIGGSYIYKEQGNIYNSFILFNKDGSINPIYHKTHLIKIFDEEKYFKPGNRLQVLQTPMGYAGLSVCYDLRFPEIFRGYSIQGAEFILLVAEWPKARIEHWRTLLRARAIENQIFVAAANCVGTSGKNEFGGFSCAVSPFGQVLGEANGVDENLISVNIDLSEIKKARQGINYLEDRRADLY